MAQIQPPETFDFSTPNEWPKWRKRFERYLVVSGMKKKEEADKIDLFMYLMGDRADDIFRTFKFEKEEEATKIDSILKAFDSHFCVRKNIIYERAKFNSRIQEDREPVDEFITSLYKLADSCEFEGLHEQLIRDRIVVGVRDKALSERMQLDSELTLEKAVKMVKFNSKKQSPKQQQQPSRKKEKSAKTRSRCPKCGGFTHREGQACRAEGQRCNLCSKTGHFANCCPDKQAKTAEVKAVSELDEEIGFLLEVSAVEDSSNLDDDEGECRRRWTTEIQMNGKQVKFKLDSQADVTCVPLCLFKKIMGQQRLVESDINIRAADFSELQTVGMFISTLRNGNYEIKEKIYVICRLSEPLLSRRACELSNLARRIEVVATRINPIKEFPEVFEGLGQIGNPYEIKLKPGAKPYAVHTLRRVPIPLMEKLKTRLEELDKDEILTKIFEAQQEDTTLKAVVNYLEQDWPDKKKISQTLLSYWHVKEELGVQNGLLMRSCRLVIPASMKLEILDKLHAGLGITKTRLRARETVWWSGISEEIAETVRKCSVCIQEAVSKHEPLIPTNFPARPWQKIGMDLFKFENKWYLVGIDYYSRFPEMIQLDRLTANVVVRSCKSIFARHGIPETVVSDNGTQFGAAREFANFARQYGFTHVTSSPRFPQSNGMAEAGVKIAKLILKKNQDPSLGLLEYRSTPLENGYSPAELLMGRKLRTTLPIAPENHNPRLVDSQTLKRKEGRRIKNMKSRYDRRCGATNMEELSEVGTVRRNRFHLRKGDTVQYPADPSTLTFSGEELVENEKTPVVDYPSSNSEDGQIRIRSGPIVKPFNPNNGNEISSYLERFESYCIANDIVKIVKKKATFFSLCGRETYNIIRTLTSPKNPLETEWEEIVAGIKKYFDPTPNIIVQRFKFAKRLQIPNETISEFITALKKIAEKCEFPDVEDRLRDALVCGILSEEIQSMLLMNSMLTFKVAQEMALAHEAAVRNVAEIKDGKPQEEINVMGRAVKVRRRNEKIFKCFRCGYTNHREQQCFFKEKRCFKCQKLGHISRVCKNGNGRSDRNNNCSIDEEAETIYGLFNINQVKDTSNMRNYMVKVRTSGRDMIMLIYSGTRKNIISEKTYIETWVNSERPRIEKDYTKLVQWNRQRLSILGKIKADVKVNKRSITMEFLVIEAPGPNLIGREAFDQIGIGLEWMNYGDSVCQINEVMNGNGMAAAMNGTANGMMSGANGMGAGYMNGGEDMYSEGDGLSVDGNPGVDFPLFASVPRDQLPMRTTGASWILRRSGGTHQGWRKHLGQVDQ
ncbi:hypothetical protein LAZ67_19000010 [Cordylochernes scorpioides]|uniref:RNA-directed DNA polymerase n=1 Tax=Cordylochernes scorpioides TaxID=51811 RepID=A0ABY6LI93_9ARAC|nr:hypothetical protein LAZ67_19000010 [Cordylochernes scorpioides]